MDSKDELREIDRACYYFDKVIEFEDFHFDDVSLDKNVLVCDILYNSLINTKPFCIMFDKVNSFIWAYDRTRYLALLNPENMIPFKLG